MKYRRSRSYAYHPERPLCHRFLLFLNKLDTLCFQKPLFGSKIPGVASISKFFDGVSESAVPSATTSS